MRKSILAIALLVVFVTGSIASAQSMLVGGIRTHEGDIDPYVYLETKLLDKIDVGVEYYHGVLGLSLWFGQKSGLYGEVTWANGFSSQPETGEVGLWRETDLSDRLRLYGWFGAKRSLVAPVTTWLTLNGEVQMKLNDQFTAVAGAQLEMAQTSKNFNGWVGIGYHF